MTPDQHKLVAKIQYFHDFMNKRLQQCEDTSITGNTDLERLFAREKTNELDVLQDEFLKAFQVILYYD